MDALFRSLRERGHDLRVVSRLNVRDLWRGRVPARRFVKEALLIRRDMKQYSPDGWIIYNPSRTYPDVFGWWQRPRRYILIAAHTWQSKSVPHKWRPLLSWTHRRSVKRADVITTWRSASLDRLLREGAAATRLRVLLPAFPIWNPMPSQKEARIRLGFAADAPIVLCATRFSTETKHGKTQLILDLLSVIHSLPADVQLVLTGDGEGRAQVEAKIADLELGDRVRLVGQVEREELKWVFAACDVYAYPHRLDWPWSSIFEAQACGRPVVAMRTKTNELSVKEGHTGLLADTLEEFKDNLAALTSDRSRCAEMGDAARNFYAHFLSIEVRTREIEAFLHG